MTSRPSFDAIVLAGGRARRLHSVDKPATQVGPDRLIDIALAAVADAGQIVVVGPDRDLPPNIVATQEDPPFSGPAAAIAAGLAALPEPSDRPVVILASDLPDLRAGHVHILVEELSISGAPAVFAADNAGQPQYLLGAWSPTALTAARAATADGSVRSLVPVGARYVVLAGTGDVDTTEDLDRAQRRAALRAAPDRRDPLAVRAMLLAELPPRAPHRCPAADTAGTVLAAPLVAATGFPPFDASAMDGYAVAGPSPWTLVDAPRAAGHTDTPPLPPGHASAIATGAALPPGADRVLRHEETRLDGDVLTETSVGRDDTRRTGSAWPAGTELAPTGLAVDAAIRSVARAAGLDELTVRGPLRARLHTSGDEIVPGSGAELPWGTLPDTASGPVGDLLAHCGLTVSDGGHLADRPSVFGEAVAARDVDLTVIIGATGHGVADHLRAALTGIGARILVDGIALRPGGSLIVAHTPGDTIVVGLGGNPLAAVAGTAVVVPAILDALLARRPRQPELLDVVDAEALEVPDRWRVLPVEPDGRGRWTVTAGRGTGHLASAVGHRGLALVPPAGSGRGIERLY